MFRKNTHNFEAFIILSEYVCILLFFTVKIQLNSLIALYSITLSAKVLQISEMRVQFVQPRKRLDDEFRCLHQSHFGRNNIKQVPFTTLEIILLLFNFMNTCGCVSPQCFSWREQGWNKKLHALLCKRLLTLEAMLNHTNHPSSVAHLTNLVIQLYLIPNQHTYDVI